MGGGAIRTAAKAAALGGYRTAVARGSSRPQVSSVPTVAATSGGAGQSTPLLSVDKGDADAPAVSSIQRPSWETDDWEFAGGKDEEIFDSLRPVPRLVFGPAPTLEEAKDATSDLKDAIEKVYFAPTTEVKMQGIQEYAPSGSAAIIPSVPKHVAQAFSLLQGSPEAQDVVASIAADKSVWDAVMKNEKVMEFYKTHQSVLPSCETIVDSANSVAEEVNTDLHAENPEKLIEEETPESSVFMDVVNAVKDKVSEMVANISNFFEGLIGPSIDGQSSPDTKTSTVDIAIGASFMALAIAAILVVLLKRG
ncbi:hypothetical protein J5N97_002793 [Dioscorea zingiberensis]|uniref:Uncharacterized protein n=1 Tax=Dioscorea zingiberensis TaxID=325984 RepID=A0A9D5HQQ1_9LILI|nr:hypothetical protein J5N97_002793 [Dioscorea zingiberensis]